MDVPFRSRALERILLSGKQWKTCRRRRILWARSCAVFMPATSWVGSVFVIDKPRAIRRFSTNLRGNKIQKIRESPRPHRTPAAIYICVNRNCELLGNEKGRDGSCESPGARGVTRHFPLDNRPFAARANTQTSARAKRVENRIIRERTQCPFKRTSFPPPPFVPKISARLD